MIYNPDGSYKHVDGNRWPSIKRRLFLAFLVGIFAFAAWMYFGYSEDRKLKIALTCLEEYCDTYKVDFYDFESFPQVYKGNTIGAVYIFNYINDPYLELRVVVPKDPWDAPQTFLYRRQKPRVTSNKQSAAIK